MFETMCNEPSAQAEGWTPIESSAPEGHRVVAAGGAAAQPMRNPLIIERKTVSPRQGRRSWSVRLTIERGASIGAERVNCSDMFTGAPFAPPERVLIGNIFYGLRCASSVATFRRHSGARPERHGLSDAGAKATRVRSVRNELQRALRASGGIERPAGGNHPPQSVGWALPTCIGGIVN